MKERLNPSRPILVVDDEKAILLTIDLTLRMAGLNNIVTCQDSRQVLELIALHEPEVMLLDLTMPHLSGEEVLTMVVRDFPEIPVIIITGSMDVEIAVRCMKSGAFDYLVKPVEHGRLITTVSRAMDHRELKFENMALKQHLLSGCLERPDAFTTIITNNKLMLALFQYVESIAPSSQPVLITGETGVGKELFASAIHNLSGRQGPFVAVNVAELDDTVFSDTLFGHVKGAFTGADRIRGGLIERASGGTLFLDEIGDLSPTSQAKLLRLIQEAEYLPLGEDRPRRTDARILTATNQSLWVLNKEGRFRADLNHRLRTHHLHIPPLRDRLDDLPLLVDQIMEEAALDLNKKKPNLPPELFILLEKYSFPGNIRELRSMIFDAVSRHKSKILSLETFKAHMDQEERLNPSRIMNDTSRSELVSFSGKLPTLKETAEALVAEAMKRSNGNQSVAARMLGISQQALSKRLKKSSG